ncbi:hypothetical protein LWE13_001944, partial [Escherichia coli]|nr:hypothetical protein [Escherichia coli]
MTILTMPQFARCLPLVRIHVIALVALLLLLHGNRSSGLLSWSTSNNWKQNGDASAPVVAPLFYQREGIYRPKSGRRD